ncbi:MAG: glycosyltransferase [Nitrososphaeria archaeon]
MLSLGLADSLAITARNGGGERHVREVMKRLSAKYELYYLPTAASFSPSDRPSERQLIEVKKYARVPSFFEHMLDEGRKFSFSKELLSFSSLAKELEEGYEREIGGLDFLYIPHNSRVHLMHTTVLAKLSDGRYGMLLMTDPHFSLLEKESFWRCFDVWTKISGSRRLATEWCIARRLQCVAYLEKTRRMKPKFIGVTNTGTFNYTRLPDHFDVRLLSPPYAFNRIALRYRNFDKEDYVVFLGTMAREKGAHEALEVGKRFRMKMMVFPLDKAIERRAKDLGIEVLQGLGSSEETEGEKLEILSKAKALILPSHQESFSVTTLEALAVGTPVIAYDLPSLTSIYRFKPVFFVREFDVNGLISKAKEVTEMSDRRVEEMFSYDELDEFIELHSSWDNVGRAVDSLIRDAVTNPRRTEKRQAARTPSWRWRRSISGLSQGKAGTRACRVASTNPSSWGSAPSRAEQALSQRPRIPSDRKPS